MPQDEDAPAEEVVHGVKAGELGSERKESSSGLLHEESLPGDTDEADLGPEHTTPDLKSEPSPQLFEDLGHCPSNKYAGLAVAPTELTKEEEIFDEVDIGADAPASPIGQSAEAVPAEEHSLRPGSDIDLASTPSDVALDREPAEGTKASSSAPENRVIEVGDAIDEQISGQSVSTSSYTPPGLDGAHGSAEQTSREPVPDVIVNTRIQGSAQSEHETPSALGPAFDSPNSIAHRRQLPPLSVTPTPISASPSPSADAHPVSPMFRSTSMSSSRVGIVSPRSAKGSPRVIMSPKFRSIDAMHADDDEDDGMEEMPIEGAPFESIPLDADVDVVNSLSRTGSRSSRQTHSRQASRESNPARTSMTNGHSRVDSHGVPITDRPRTPVGRVATPRESPRDGNAQSSPHVASPKVNPVPANANNQPSQALGVKGVNAFEKFVSRTRPAHLPPKDKSEDMEHLHQWESMMAQAKQHDAEERKKQQQRQLQREKRIVEVAPRWDAMLNAKDFSAAKVQADPVKRKLWFEGCPPRLRGKAWQLAIGNPLAMHKGGFVLEPDS